MPLPAAVIAALPYLARTAKVTAPIIREYIKKKGVADAIRQFGKRVVQNKVPSVIPKRRTTPPNPKSGPLAKPKAKEGEFIPKTPKGKQVVPKEPRKGKTFNQEKPMFTENRRRTTPPPNPKSGPQKNRNPNQTKAALGAGAGATALGVSTSTNKDKPTTTTSVRSYTIKSGDTLSAIAKRYGVRLSEIKAANPNIKNLNKIRPGQKIKVPKESIKGTGKSIYEGMTKAQMAKIAMKKKK